MHSRLRLVLCMVFYSTELCGQKKQQILKGDRHKVHETQSKGGNCRWLVYRPLASLAWLLFIIDNASIQ